MAKLRYVGVLAGALLLTCTTARADTFQLSATILNGNGSTFTVGTTPGIELPCTSCSLSGTITFDVPTGNLLPPIPTVTETGNPTLGPFTFIAAMPGTPDTIVSFDSLEGVLEIVLPVPNLAGYTGGSICGTNNSPTSSCAIPSLLSTIVDLHQSFYLIDQGTLTDISVSATPLPTSLPLFATALGGLGLLGWRKKRKAQAVA